MAAHYPVPGAILQITSPWRGSLQVLRAAPAQGRSGRQADAAGRRGLSMARRTDMLSTLGALLLLAPVASADTGRTAFASPHSGGAAYVAAPPRPVVRTFSVSPRTVTAPALPTVRFRLEQ